VSARLLSPWRIASVAVVLGLLGSAIVTLALVDSATTRAAGRRPSPGDELKPAIRIGQAAETSTGLRLLEEAAAACQNVSYRGVQIVAWWGDDGTATSVVEVWHQPGRGTLARAADTDAGPLDPLQSPLSGGQNPDGILGVSGQLLVLMRANYEVVSTGDGDADNRPARIVEVRGPGGKLAARFWLDAATKLPLRRELFDNNARVISEDAFINLTVGASGLADMPVAAARPWAGRLGESGLAALRAMGWPLPGRLPGNLVLFASDQTSTRSGQVADLSYSDGLSIVSLFVQRGVLPRALSGWRPVVVRGRPVYAADSGDRSLAWSARGFVFTLIADAPSATVGQVVAAMPRDADPGFWQRLGRGFRRLGSWVNPFG
jgi:hypothetical protein